MGAYPNIAFLENGAVYQENKPVNFIAKVADFSAQIEQETQGELSLEPVDCGCVNLLYKNKWLARLHIVGLKKADIHERILTIFKACVIFSTIDIFES